MQLQGGGGVSYTHPPAKTLHNVCNTRKPCRTTCTLYLDIVPGQPEPPHASGIRTVVMSLPPLFPLVPPRCGHVICERAHTRGMGWDGEPGDPLKYITDHFHEDKRRALCGCGRRPKASSLLDDMATRRDDALGGCGCAAMAQPSACSAPTGAANGGERAGASGFRPLPAPAGPSPLSLSIPPQVVGCWALIRPLVLPAFAG